MLSISAPGTQRHHRSTDFQSTSSGTPSAVSLRTRFYVRPPRFPPPFSLWFFSVCGSVLFKFAPPPMDAPDISLGESSVPPAPVQLELVSFTFACPSTAATSRPSLRIIQTTLYSPFPNLEFNKLMPNINGQNCPSFHGCKKYSPLYFFDRCAALWGNHFADD